jgi:hypothetical protein
MSGEYDEQDTYGNHGEENEDLEKDITGHAHDAENALLNMIEDYQVEKLQDPDVWEVVEGFMSRVVKLLSYLEDVHEENRPEHAHDGGSSRLDELQDQMAENDENAEHDQHEDSTGHNHYDENDHSHQQEEGGDGHWDENGEGNDEEHNYNGHECYDDENRY